MKKTRVKELWRNGEAAVGTWLVLGSPIAAEIIAHLGFDWVVIDTEHGSIDIDTTQSIVQAISTTDTVPIIRVPWNDPMSIKRALDAGAYGLVIPMVNSREEAISAVKATRYPPLGNRSYGGPRVRLYGGVDYFEHANEEIPLIVQIEHIDAVNHVDEILSVEGIDGFFIGPSDLAISLGLKPGLDNTNPKHVAAVSRILASGKKHGVAGGIQVGSAEAVNERITQGFQFIALTGDDGFLRSAALAAVNKVNKDRKVS
ncbi:MAG: aldolase/citrate lyase family protein [Dehalococcoidales bacterium]|nr:aldolase/citrate lyase family protein [Dehalococcoidales bacterium]